VKENRTYDQILGDVREGNGDPDLAEFGGQVTPNQHALAHQFVLLDNFYDCGEVSGDGWTWSTASMANEAMIKAVPYQYSGRGRNYDYEGQTDGYPVGGLPAKDAYGEPMSKAFPNGAPAIPDVAATRSGRIWDTMRRSGLSYRNYGFFLTNGVAIYRTTTLMPLASAPEGTTSEVFRMSIFVDLIPTMPIAMPAKSTLSATIM
jgi:hypothetical protein